MKQVVGAVIMPFETNLNLRIDEALMRRPRPLTGSLCCDAWLGEPVDEHGRLLKAPPGHRYEEVDALATTSVAIASIASTAMKHATATSLTGATRPRAAAWPTHRQRSHRASRRLSIGGHMKSPGSNTPVRCDYCGATTTDEDANDR